MARWPCTGEVKGEARYAYAPGRSSAVFLLGYMGFWNRDRDCEPAQLTVAARMGEIEGESSSVYRAQKPRPGRPERRGFATRHWRCGPLRLGTYCWASACVL